MSNNTIPLPETDWLHLKPFGYAPGGYMSRCMHCTNVVTELDKRAVSCRPCAAKVHEIERLRKEVDAAAAVTAAKDARIKVLEERIKELEGKHENQK